MLYFWSFHYVEIILDFVETVYTAKIWAGLLQKIRLDFAHQGLSLFFYSPKQQNSLFYFNTMKMNVEKMLTEIICKFFLLYSLKKWRHSLTMFEGQKAGEIPRHWVTGDTRDF